MRGAFDDDFEQEPGQLRRDTEWTLGSGALMAIFGGLVILCGLCFGLGYTLGHRSSQAPAAAAPTAEVASQSAPGGSLTKPSATEGTAQPATVQAASVDPATETAP